MSVNLGNEAVLALGRLKDNTDFQKFIAGYTDFVHDEMHKALDAAPEHIVLSQARARAFRDVWQAMVGGVRVAKPSQVEKREIHRGKAPRAALPTTVFANGDEPDGSMA